MVNNLKILINESQLKYIISEYIQQADKLYFNDGKLSPEIKEVIMDVCGGDSPHFKHLCDLAYHFNKFSILNPEKDRSLFEYFFTFLLSYDKSFFPLKYDLKEYNAHTDDNDKHILTMFSILKERYYLINTFNKLPSIAKRNLSYLKKTVGDSENLFTQLTEKLKELLSFIKRFVNSENSKHKIILNKIFNSKNKLDDSIKIAQHYSEQFSDFNSITINEIKQLLKTINSKVVDYKEKNYLIIKVNDHESMQTLGCNSLWCFARGDQRYWDDYAINGYVYIIFNFNEDRDNPKFMMVYLPYGNELYDTLNNIVYDGEEYLYKLGIDTRNLI